MVISETGEDTVLFDPKSGYAANQERAETGKRAVERSTVEPKPLTKLHTPNVGSIEAVSKFLKCKPHQMLKTLIYTADDQPIAVLIRAVFGGLARPWRLAPGGRADSDVLQILGNGTRMRALSWLQWHPDVKQAAPLPATAGRPGGIACGRNGGARSWTARSRGGRCRMWARPRP